MKPQWVDNCPDIIITLFLYLYRKVLTSYIVRLRPSDPSSSTGQPTPHTALSTPPNVFLGRANGAGTIS